MLFIDKYSPKNEEDLIFHKKEFGILKKMSQDDSLPHIIFYGPEGSGKKTLIKLYLEMIYDEQVNQLCESIYKVTGSGNNSTEVSIKQSNYHIIIDPNNNNFDRYLIQDVVKEYAKKIPLNIFSSKKPFKTVLINSIDNLSYYAQTSLRRTMEKYSETCRFVMWCRSLSRVIDPIRSRCHCFRIQSPTNEQLFDIVSDISFKEHISLTLNDYHKIINRSDGSIKKILWMMQLKKIGEDFETSYEQTIDEIVVNLLESKKEIDGIVTNIYGSKMENLPKIRELFYNIMITNIPGTQIMKDIVKKLFDHKNVPDIAKLSIVEVSAHYEHNLIRGRREIMHFEGFIVSVIHILHNYYKSQPKLKNENTV